MFVPCNSCGQPVDVHARFCPGCGQEYPAHGSDRIGAPTPDDWQASYDAAVESIAREDLQNALALLGQAIVDAPQSQIAKCQAMRGYAYLRLRQYDRALCDCNEAIKLDPDYGEAIAWRASAHAGFSRWREAIEDLKLAIELCPANALDYEQVALSHTENAILDFRQRVKSGDASCQLFHDRGVIYAFRGEFEKAIRDFTQAIEANASHAPSYFERAECLSETGRSREALDDCTTAVDLGFSESSVFRLRSVLAEQCDDLDLALADLNTFLTRQEDDAPSFQRRAQIFARQQRFELANRDYTLLIRIDDSHPDVFVARGIVRTELGDYWGAIADFSHSLEKVPDDAETLALRGEANLALNRTKQALAEFDAAIELNSACTSARRGRALVYSACGRYDQAMALLEKVLRLDPRYGLAFAAKGRVYQESQRFSQAVEAFGEAIEFIGDGRGAADLYYRRGVCLASGESWVEAANDFNEAIRRRQTHAGSYIWRANVRFRTGDWDSALDDLAAASQLNPTDAPHYRKLAESACQNVIEQLTKSIAAEQSLEKYRERGIARHFIGQADLALEDFNVVIQGDPADAIARIHRANILRDYGDAQSAIADYDAVIVLESKDATHRFERAACLLKLGNHKRALTDINAGIELDPNSANAYLQRAKLLSRHGQVNAALSDLDRAICFAPQRAEAYYERAQIRAARKQYSAAIEDSSSALERAPHLYQAVMLRAELHSRAGDNERALTDFEAAIASSCLSVQVHCGRALTLARLVRHALALRELTKVLRLFEGGELATLLGCRAKIAYNAGQFRRALADFDVALSLGSLVPQQKAQLLYGRGLAMFQLKDSEGAKAAICRSVDLDPKNQAALDVRDWLTGTAGVRPVHLDPPSASVKLHAPPITRSASAGAVVDDKWDSNPPWNLWLVGISDGERDIEFGPVDKPVLDRWCQQGRIDARTLLLRTDWDEWKWASEIYPQLGNLQEEIPRKEKGVKSKEPDDVDSGDSSAFPEIQV